MGYRFSVNDKQKQKQKETTEFVSFTIGMQIVRKLSDNNENNDKTKY